MKKINSLQAWRAIFIVLICIEHMGIKNKLSLLGAGGEGVSYFIVLSGFLVGYIYRNRIVDASIKNTSDYLIKKIKKFYPLHILAIILSVVLNAADIAQNFGIDTAKMALILVKAILNALFLQVYIPVEGWYMNSVHGIGWFLSTIMFCYAFALIGMMIIKKASKLKVLPILFLSVLIIRIALSFVLKGSMLDVFFLYVFPPVRYLEFFLAMILGYGQFEIIFSKANVFIDTIVELSVIIIFAINHFMIKSGIYAGNASFMYLSMLIVSLTIVCVFSLEKGAVSKLMSNRLLVLVGDLSFFIYIMHQVIIQYIHGAIKVIGWKTDGTILCVIAIVLYTVLVNKYYDAVIEKFSKIGRKK